MKSTNDKLFSSFGYLISIIFFILPLILFLSSHLFNLKPFFPLDDSKEYFYFGLKYAFITSISQILLGIIVAYSLTIEREEYQSFKIRVIQLLIDIFVLLPYFIPSIAWKWFAFNKIFSFSDHQLHFLVFEYFLNNKVSINIYNPDNYNRILLFITSTIHLYPFSYIIFRFFFSSISRKAKIYANNQNLNTFSYILLYRKKDFLSILLMLFLYRFFIMQGKFDLPYYFGGQVIHELKNLPVYINDLILNDINWLPKVSFILSYLVLISSFLLIIYFGFSKIIRKLEKRSNYREKSFIQNLIVSIILLLNKVLYKTKLVFIIKLLLKIFGFSSFILITFSIIYVIINDINSLPFNLLINHQYISSLLFSISIILISISFIPLFVYFIYIQLKLYPNFINRIVRFLFLLFFIIPPVFYYIYIYSVIPKDSIFSYFFFISAPIIPLAYFQFSNSIGSLNNKSTIYISSLPNGFTKNFFKIYFEKATNSTRLIVLAIMAIVINEIFGALNILPSETLSKFLLNANEVFNNNYSLIFMSILPIVFISIIFYILFKFINHVYIFKK